jgi:hypothetical protein
VGGQYFALSQALVASEGADHLAIATEIEVFRVGSEPKLLVTMLVLLNAQQMESWLMCMVVLLDGSLLTSSSAEACQKGNVLVHRGPGRIGLHVGSILNAKRRLATTTLSLKCPYTGQWQTSWPWCAPVSRDGMVVGVAVVRLVGWFPRLVAGDRLPSGVAFGGA